MGLRGQGVLLDFFFSVAVFVSILVIAFAVFNNYSLQSDNADTVKDVNSVAQAVADALANNKGKPDDWNSTNFNAIGLQGNSGLVSRRKFVEMNAIGYDPAKAALGAGAYQIKIELVDANGTVLNAGLVYRGPVALFLTDSTADEEAKAIGILNNSGIPWDLYWNGAGQPPSGTYNTATTGVNGTELFQNLLEQTRRYAFLIIYKGDVNLTQMNTANRTLFRQVVYNGTRLVIIGSKANNAENLITTEFNATGFKYATGIANANVTELDDVLFNVSLQQTQLLNDPSYYLNLTASIRKFKVIATDNSPLSCSSCQICTICSMDYGSGRIHFLTDYTPGFATGFTSIVGNATTFGQTPPATASQVAVVKRVVAIDSNARRDFAALNVIVYQN